MKHKIFFLFAIIIAFSSCCFSTEKIISIKIPNVENATSLVLIWVDGNNLEQRKQINLTSETCTYAVPLTVSKNSCTPILLKFYASDKEMISSPYGMIYPHCLEPTQEDSFAAEILRILYVSSTNANFHQVQDYLACFNWQRFMEECRKFDEPWNLNKEIILKAIASGTFKKTDLKLCSEDVQ